MATDLLEDANEVDRIRQAKVEAMVKTAQSRIDDLLRDEKLDALVFYDNEGVLVASHGGIPRADGARRRLGRRRPKRGHLRRRAKRGREAAQHRLQLRAENRRTCNSRELPELEPPSIDERLNASSTTSRTNKLKRKNGES